jgi:hypothetical protein
VSSRKSGVPLRQSRCHSMPWVVLGRPKSIRYTDINVPPPKGQGASTWPEGARITTKCRGPLRGIVGAPGEAPQHLGHGIHNPGLRPGHAIACRLGRPGRIPVAARKRSVSSRPVHTRDRRHDVEHGIEGDEEREEIGDSLPAPVDTRPPALDLLPEGRPPEQDVDQGGPGQGQRGVRAGHLFVRRGMLR